jgi:hypothetical protein
MQAAQASTSAGIGPRKIKRSVSMTGITDTAMPILLYLFPSGLTQ